MPRYTCTWKDPDFFVASQDETNHHLEDEIRNALYKAGAREYLTVEFDTDNNTATVLLPKRKA